MRFFGKILRLNRREQKTRSLGILLAEDAPVHQVVTAGILEKHGHSVTVAKDGRQVLDLLARYTFDLVLMDVQMPIMDGLVSTREIRNSRFAFRSIPIIAMTAHSMEVDLQACFDAGMDGCLPKPIKPEELLAAISKCVRHGGVSRGKKEPTPEPGKLSTGSVVNVTEAVARMAGDLDLFREAMGIFLEDAKERLEILRNGMERDDWEIVGKSAHRIKGAAASMSAGGVRKVASELERIAEAKDLGRAMEVLALLKIELEEVEKFALEHCFIEHALAPDF